MAASIIRVSMAIFAILGEGSPLEDFSSLRNQRVITTKLNVLQMRRGGTSRLQRQPTVQRNQKRKRDLKRSDTAGQPDRFVAGRHGRLLAFG